MWFYCYFNHVKTIELIHSLGRCKHEWNIQYISVIGYMVSQSGLSDVGANVLQHNTGLEKKNIWYEMSGLGLNY